MNRFNKWSKLDMCQDCYARLLELVSSRKEEV